MKPILCKAGQQLREQFDDSYQDRDRRSDGWVADARHIAQGTSDHIPDSVTGIVRALDVDRDVSGTAKPDLMPDIAYVIFNGRIASPRLGWRWRVYRGSNPHNHHCHISFTKKGDTDGSFFNIPLLGGTL
jgi:hypothetical protein